VVEYLNVEQQQMEAWQMVSSCPLSVDLEIDSRVFSENWWLENGG
jgi:hypothetical protein